MAFNANLGIDAKCRKGRKRFEGKVFDLPVGVHDFEITWASEKKADYPCFGVRIGNFLPTSMLATDYELACSKSPEPVQAKAWVGSERIHPNFEEIQLNVGTSNRPESLLLKK
jgi:hypothetical protein